MGAMEECPKDHSNSVNEAVRIFSEHTHGNVVVEDVINSIRRLESDNESIVIFISGATCTNDNALPPGSAAIGVFFSPSSSLNLSERIPDALPKTIAVAEMYAIKSALEEFYWMAKDNTNLWHSAKSISTQITSERENAENAVNNVSNLDEKGRDVQTRATRSTDTTYIVSDSDSESTIVVTDSDSSGESDNSTQVTGSQEDVDMVADLKIVREDTTIAPKRFGISRVVIVTECENLIDTLCEEGVRGLPRVPGSLPHTWNSLRRGERICQSVRAMQERKNSLLPSLGGSSTLGAAEHQRILEEVQSLDSKLSNMTDTDDYKLVMLERNRIKEIADAEGLSAKEERSLLELKWGLYHAVETVERLCPLDLWLVEKGTILEARNLALLPLVNGQQ